MSDTTLTTPNEDDDETTRKRKILTINADIMRKWEPKHEMFALHYGSAGLVIPAAVSSYVLNNHFRKVYNLGQYKPFHTAIPTFAVSCLLTLAYNEGAMRNQILAEETDCPVCMEVRGGYIQSVSGVFFPLMVAAAASSRVARNLDTKEFLKVTRKENPFKFLYRIAPWKFVLTMLIVNFASGSFLSLFQMTEFSKIRQFKRLDASDNKLIESDND